MYNKASLYQEVQHLREYMGISLSDTTLDIIEYCKREYSDIKTEAIPLKTSGLHGMMVPPESNSEPYIILLNSSRSEIEQRFDYTHELMHIALHKKVKRNFNCFDSPGQHQDKFIEWEANEGAAEFLLPYKVFIPQYLKLSKLHAREWLNSYPVRLLANEFNVTDSVVANRIKSLNYEIYQYMHGIHVDQIRIESATSLEKRGWKKSHIKHYCVNCLTPINLKQSFCHVCGQRFPNGTFKRLAYIAEGAGYMVFEGIKLNNNGKAVVCPICGNEEILEEGEYCHICGSLLINRCDMIKSNDDQEPIGYCPGHKPLSGNARYCPYCGGETTFLKTGALKPWNDKNKLRFEDISDEEDMLPF